MLRFFGQVFKGFRKLWIQFSFRDSGICSAKKNKSKQLNFCTFILEFKKDFCDGGVKFFGVSGAAAVEVFLGAGRWSWAPYGAPEGVREAGGGDPDGRRGGR